MTISEMASVLDVSGASITALVKNWKLKPTKTGQYNRKYYSAKDTERILNHYRVKAKTKTKSAKPVSKDEIIAALRDQVKQQQHQLDVKDDQISELNEQLKMAQVNLNQSQQLQLNQAKRLERLEAPQQATGSHESHSGQDDKEKIKSEPKDVKKAPGDPENGKGKTTIKEKILNFFQKSWKAVKPCHAWQEAQTPESVTSAEVEKTLAISALVRVSLTQQLNTWDKEKAPVGTGNTNWSRSP